MGREVRGERLRKLLGAFAGSRHYIERKNFDKSLEDMVLFFNVRVARQSPELKTFRVQVDAEV